MNPLWLLLAMAGPAPDASVEAEQPAALDGAVPEATDAPKDGDARADTGGSADAETPRQLRGRVLAKGSRGPVLAARITATGASGVVQTSESEDDGSFALSLRCGLHRR